MPDAGAHCPCCGTGYEAGRAAERQRLSQLLDRARAEAESYGDDFEAYWFSSVRSRLLAVGDAG